MLVLTGGMSKALLLRRLFLTLRLIKVSVAAGSLTVDFLGHARTFPVVAVSYV